MGLGRGRWAGVVTLAALGWFGGALLGRPGRARACLHPPKDTPVKVGQDGQHGLILYENGLEDLVLRVAAHSEEPLAALAWVVPVPSAPLSYAVADDGLFEALERWVRLRWKTDPRLRARVRGPASSGRGHDGAGALRFLRPVQVGPYRIQPVQGQGPGAVRALAAWMRAQGFVQIPEASTRYYAERGWTFLAIRVAPPQGESTLPTRGALPPLRIRFRTPVIVYPLKFSTHMGRMRVRVDVLTPRPLERAALEGARRRGFHVWSASRGYLPARGPRHRLDGAPAVLRARIRGRRRARQMPSALRRLVEERFGGRPVWLTVLLSERFNAPSRRPRQVVYRAADWAEDLTVPGLPEGVRLQLPLRGFETPFLPCHAEAGTPCRPSGRAGAPPSSGQANPPVDPWADAEEAEGSAADGTSRGRRNPPTSKRPRIIVDPFLRQDEPSQRQGSHRVVDPWAD